MSDTTRELVERLRAEAISHREYGHLVDADMMMEAAAELERLTAENAALRKVVEVVANHAVGDPLNEFIGGQYADVVVRLAKAALKEPTP